MKFLLIALSFFASIANAHEDHMLADNVHIAYHIVFWTLVASIVLTFVYRYLQRKKKK
ncbi:hypothetical protein [Pseudoalteromonas distincta]|uniref:CcmD family protein n=1 Tax=Pseudoalteromonas distincta TaxID=77608 RepID=A0ABT9GHB8_9GAMM|nr:MULTISPECIES: hypothetical protein [Pseudoalteromonas distincta group]MDP4485281.1 hypothetical protein [Pseudoalteromonas elyakovii]